MSVELCIVCTRVQPPPYGGPAVCLEDGVDIRQRNGYCPLKHFGTGIAPAGWQSIPIDVTKFGKPLPPAPKPKPLSPALEQLGLELFTARRARNLTPCAAGNAIGSNSTIVTQIESGYLDAPELREKLKKLYASGDAAKVECGED